MDIRNIFGNGDRDNTSFDSSLQEIKDKYDALEKLLAEREEKIASLEKQIATLEAGQSTTPTSEGTPEVVATEDTPKEQTPTPTPEAPSAELLAALTAAIAELKTQHEDLKAASADIKEHVTYRSTLIKQDIGELHKGIMQFSPEMFEKITKPYKFALLDLHRRFHENAQQFVHLKEGEDINVAYQNLVAQFSNAVSAIADRVYNDFGIEYNEPEVGDAFDPKCHQSMEVIETPEEAKHRIIARVYHGYFVDTNIDKVIRPARVAIYKYVAPAVEEQSNEPTETPQEQQ